MTQRSEVSWAALGVACVALAMASYAALRPPPTVPPATAPALDARLDALERRIQASEAAVRVIAAPPATPPSGQRPDADAPDLPEVRAGATPVYASLDVDVPGVTVHQDPSGALSVVNTDPARTGEILFVTGTLPDGSTQQVPITVPPPP